MISKLLRLIEEANGEVHLLDLSHALGAQPSAVLGMVEMLQRKGRLTAVAPTCGACDSCGLKKNCTVPPTTTSYQIAVTGKT